MRNFIMNGKNKIFGLNRAIFQTINVRQRKEALTWNKHFGQPTVMQKLRLPYLGNCYCKNYFSTSATSLQNTSNPFLQQIVESSKKRTIRKRIKPTETQEDTGQENKNKYNVLAYATAVEYDLEKLVNGFKKQGLYCPTSMKEENLEDVLHVSARYQVGRDPREIYLFREGAVVFWNFRELERENVLTFLKSFEEGSYDSELVLEESEALTVIEINGGTKTRLTNSGVIYLNTEDPADFEKYAFSNAIAQSVKLAIWESSLSSFIGKIEDITEDLKSSGKISLSRQDVLRKQGELFALRHSINLSSDLLDTPDFYWDRENLEPLYRSTYNYLNISKRTKVMNEKLSHCFDLIELISDKLTDKHHIRLEWMIIVLIMIEVLFEILHFIH